MSLGGVRFFQSTCTCYSEATSYSIHVSFCVCCVAHRLCVSVSRDDRTGVFVQVIVSEACVSLGICTKCVYMSAVSVKSRAGVGSPGAGVTVSCELPFLGVGNQIRGLYKTRTYSHNH